MMFSSKQPEPQKLTSKQKHALRIKDTLDILEDIMTIIVSLIALWGSLAAYQNGFWHKLKHIVDYYHQDALVQEMKKEHDLSHVLEKVKTKVSELSEHEQNHTP